MAQAQRIIPRCYQCGLEVPADKTGWTYIEPDLFLCYQCRCYEDLAVDMAMGTVNKRLRENPIKEKTMATESAKAKTAYELWRSGPRHEDYEVWLSNVVPRIMEENTKLTEAKADILRLLQECWDDISHWIQLAKVQREALDDPDHEPNTPSVAGIKNSERLQKRIGELRGRLRNEM